MFRLEVNSTNAKHLIKAQILIADEGHRLKNYKSDVVASVGKLINAQKIILTGYPLQNNLLEYWCMINVVKPNFLGTVEQFTELFKAPIEQGQYCDSTVEARKNMNYRSFVLHSLLSGVLHREEQILQSLLPPKFDFVLLLKMTPLQEKLYKLYSDGASNVIRLFAILPKIINHPDIIYNVLQNNNTTNDQSDNNEMNVIDDDLHVDFDTSTTESNDLKDSALELMGNYTTNDIRNSPKMEVVFHILKECKDLGDRVVLFSQSLPTLNIIEHFLHAELKWKQNWNYFRLDGSTQIKLREKMILEFHSNPNITLFIISTKAGGLGINLTGANRVILFDVSWNPCFDMQAVARVHRLRQKKSCFVYRLVMDSCLEKIVYNHQINKQAMSARVVDQLSSTVNLPAAKKTVTFNHENYKENEYQTTFSDAVLENAVLNIRHVFSKKPSKHIVLSTSQTLSEADKTEALNEFSHASAQIAFKISHQNINKSSTTTTTISEDTWIPEEKWQQKGMLTKIVTLDQGK